MSEFTIKSIKANEILDSRGNPTIKTEVKLVGGARGVAAVPSGASTGKFEAVELRDNDMDRYDGLGVQKACNNVNTNIAQELVGQDGEDQVAIDRMMIKLDGTGNKSNLGANAILSVSLALAWAVSSQRKMPLYESLVMNFDLEKPLENIPVPLMNIINGGKHADTNLALQEFQIIPFGDGYIKNQLEIGSEVFHALGRILKAKGLDTDVGNEGGYAPEFASIDQVFELIIEAINKTGVKAGQDVFLGLDTAANSFYDQKKKKYAIAPPKEEFDAAGLQKKYEQWFKDYPLISIEDPFAEESWDDWSRLTKKMKAKQLAHHDFMVIGDDLFVTNIKRLKKGIASQSANAILIKPNQIGSLSETIAAVKLAQNNDYKIIISHRSGETNDTTIADLAVSVGAEFIKTGAPSRGERVAKYNRLLEIARELGI